MKTVTILLAFLSIPLNVSAAGRNLISCNNADSDENLYIRQDAGGQFVALYSAELNWSGGQTTIAYKVERGGRFAFSGQDFDFQFTLDPNSNKGTGTFSIKSLGIENEQIDCEAK